MTYIDVQNQIQAGLRLAANEIGVPHSIYRVGSQSNGDVLNAENLIAQNVLVRTTVAYGGQMRLALETEKQMGMLWYNLVFDCRPFQVGDIFVNTDPVYNAGATGVSYPTLEFKGFALADRSPEKKNLGGRLNLQAYINRMSAGPDSSDRYDRTNLNAQPLILTNGQFALGTPGETGSLIPMGLLTSGRSYGDRAFDQIPGEERKSGWVCYVPPLPGFHFKAGDRIITELGARYTVIVPFGQEIGASGFQLFLEREVDQPDDQGSF
jgi:hypothetical protein